MMSNETLYAGRFIRLVRRDGWEYVERVGVTGIVMIVPITAAGEIVFCEQYRVPVGKLVIELSAGLVGDEPGHEDEPLEAAARRELREETGYEAVTMTRVAEGPPSPGITNEVITVFRAEGVFPVDAGGGVGDEAIRVHVVPLADVDGWLDEQSRAGKLIDSKVFIGLYFALRSRACG